MPISKTDLNNLTQEIKISEKLIEQDVKPQMESAVSRYMGEYIPSEASNWDVYLNEIYTVVQFELPSIFFRNPRAFLKPKTKNFIAKRRNPLTGKKEEVFLDSTKSARTQEHILNYTIEQIGYKQQVRRVLLDALMFKYGVLWHGYKGEFGMTDEASIYIESEQVFVKRLALDRFIFDPKVKLCEIDEAQWVGRSFDVLLSELVEDPDLDVPKDLKARKGFATPLRDGGKDSRSTARSTLLDITNNEFQEHAKFVRCYEIFRKPTKKERKKGSKGQIVLLAEGYDKPLRESEWPYKAKGWPCEILQFNEVPDSNFGLSDLEVYGPIADHKNLIFNLQVRNAEANSKALVFFNKEGMDEETVQQVEDGEQNVIGVDGTTQGRVQVASIGAAASSELYLMDQRIQQNLDEKSGILDLKKGHLQSGEESATSVAIRNAGTSSRQIYRQDIMADFLKRSFKFINDLNQQFMPIKDAVRIMGSMDIEWSENPSKEEIQADVDVDIDAISMLPENPQKEIQELQTILNLMTQALTVPAIFQKIQQEGKTFNLSPLIDNLLMRLKLRDPDIFRSIEEDESQGYASINELTVAYQNVQAILSGQEPPSPPEEGQDHRVRLAVYQASAQLAQQLGNAQAVQAIQQLIQIQSTVAEEESQKQNPKGAVNG